jgi:uncharacterized membrane protein YdjX (TVP38/TMEM64 family)
MRLILLFAGMALACLGVWLIWGGAWDERFTLLGTVGWLGQSGGWAWAAGIGLLVADLALPLPGTVVMAALGYVYGWWLGAWIAFVGTMLGSAAGYGAGRVMSENFVRRWLGGRDFERGRKMFGTGGGWIVALSRAVPILPEVVSCMAGMSRMRFGRFLVAAACGNAPMAVVFGAIGATGKDAPGWAVAGSILVPGVLWLVAARWQKKAGNLAP